MALMTSCPACHTFFRVVPDQLRLHLGLVRCGSCEHVFDANQRLESITEPLPTQPVTEPVNEQSWSNKPAVRALTQPNRAGEDPHAHAVVNGRGATPAPQGKGLVNDTVLSADSVYGRRPKKSQSTDTDESARSSNVTSADMAIHTEAFDSSFDSRFDTTHLNQTHPQVNKQVNNQVSGQFNGQLKESNGPRSRSRSSRNDPDTPKNGASSNRVRRPAGEVDEAALQRRRARKKAHLEKQALAAQQASEKTKLAPISSHLGHRLGHNLQQKIWPKAWLKTRSTETADSTPSSHELPRKNRLWVHHGGNILRIVLSLLGLLAMTQIMLAGRYKMADTLPASKPLLEWVCQWSRCQLEPAIWLQPLSLDALSLSKRTDITPRNGQQTYRMLATVRNSSQLTVVKPDLVLSLTNLQGVMLTRTTVQASSIVGADYLAANSIILPNGDWQIDTEIKLDEQTLGYTARLIYSTEPQ